MILLKILAFIDASLKDEIPRLIKGDFAYYMSDEFVTDCKRYDFVYTLHLLD
jgi:hypothetical protein